MLITFYGTSHGAPEIGRFCSGTLLETGGLSYLIDCGAPVDALMLNDGKSFETLRAIFLTHMHEDHCGNLSAMVKEFGHYHPTATCRVFFAEESAIEPFLAWNRAMHHTDDPNRVFYDTAKEGVFFDDGNIRVSGIPSDHIHGFNTFSYRIELLHEGKRVLFTGDMRGDLADFPKPAQEEEWDCIVSELTHYRIEQHVDKFAACRTKRLIFNHKIGYNIDAYPKIKDCLPFPSVVASDGDSFTI